MLSLVTLISCVLIVTEDVFSFQSGFLSSFGARWRVVWPSPVQTQADLFALTGMVYLLQRSDTPETLS